VVRTAKVYLLYGNLTESDMVAIKKYLMNPVESREASLEKPETLVQEHAGPPMVETLTGFTSMDEEALKAFVEDMGGNAAFGGVVAEDLRHRFVVTLEDNALMQQTYDQIIEIPGVVYISAEFEMAKGFITLQNVLQIASLAVISVLLVVSLLIISNTVKLAMYDRHEEISIMKMVGATNGFIRLPFVVEGFTLGMLGAGIAFGLEWLMYNYMVDRIAQLDASLQLFKFVPFTDLLIPMIATFAAAGFFVGVVGSWTSIRKFMNV
jgi:cell division transport system permease protein